MENNLSTDPELVLALDFGGTKLAAAVVDLTAGKVVGQVVRSKTPTLQGAGGTLQTMLDCGHKALQANPYGKLAVKAIGISFGGPVSQDRQTVLRSNHVADWNGKPLVDVVSHEFGLPTVMDNDGNVAALGEWLYGGYEQYDNLAYIQISTGVGGGFVFDHHLYRGSGLAGEIGHYLVDPNGPLCSCGRKGCLESICSGWAIARDGREVFVQTPLACTHLLDLCQHDVQAVTAEKVFEASRLGDEPCIAIIQTALKALGMVTVNLITCLNPQVVVVGGGIIRSHDAFERYYFPYVNQHLHPFFSGSCKIELSRLDGAELLLGAATLTRELK